MLAKNTYGLWDKTCTTRVVPFSVGEVLKKKTGVVQLCITIPDDLKSVWNDSIRDD